MALPFPDNSFDGVYAIEATCHAPDRTKVRDPNPLALTLRGVRRSSCLTLTYA